MDELKQVWSEIRNKSVEFTSLTQREIRETVQSKSSGVIEKLHRNVKRKFYFASSFTVVWGVIIPFAVPLASQILLLILFAAYLIGSILLYQELQILRKGIDMSQNLLHGIRTYHQRIKRVLRYEETVGLSLYPVSASAGFFLGMQMVDTEAKIMDKQLDWVVLIVSLIILTIGGHLITRWLNKVVFGKYLIKLEENIRELEAEA